MAVYVNKHHDVEEIQFVSKSYPMRKKKQ